MAYIELHASSAFSFLEGASLPEALVARAAALGYRAVALLERDGVYSAPRFHQAAKKAGLKAIIGAELTVTAGRDGERLRLPVLIESRQGYRNLCRLLTRLHLGAAKGEGTLALDDLDGQTGGLVALLGREMLSGPRYGVGGLFDRLTGIFGRGQAYVELQRHLGRDEAHDNHTLVDLAAAFHLPVLATNGVRFAAPADRSLYDVLTCLRHKTTLAAAGRRLSPNAERYLKPPAEMADLFGDLPRAVAETTDLANRLSYTMADLGYEFPRYPVPDGESMASFLRHITLAGARDRYRPIEPRHTRQLERELALIETLDLAGYFLIVWDIVNFCRQQGILVQGRGSAANSAVCYSLGITAVDPIGMDLLFERFLSEQRGEWPDIDLDLPSGDRRERVIQHVYEKYGTRGAAMTANVITYRGRSAARDVGKALGIDPARIDQLAKVMNHFEFVDPADSLARNVREVGMDGADPTIQIFATLWQQIQDLPRHLGQHSGGMVLCRGRLDEIVPLEHASMPGRVVIQWDKDDCADMGIVKVDLLGLGMMAVLEDALQLINHPTSNLQPPSSDLDPPSSLDLARLPPNDPAVYRMLCEADTIGIFQVESRAQMATLPRLRPATFYDIVVEVAIIRPGPIVGNMVHPYLARRQQHEPVVYPHPSLQPILERTLGVPLFQEQLLRMAMVAAGFSGGEAEELRRAFGFKRSEHRMQQIEEKLRAGMTRQGITGAAADEIVRSITSFALYGFPESHAASFALLVYASAFLKAHYPAAFYTAMLNNQPMGFYHPSTLVKDAQRHGVRFAPIDVQVSDWPCRVEPDGRVRLGLMYVNGLRKEAAHAIADGRSPSADRPLSMVGLPIDGVRIDGSTDGRSTIDGLAIDGVASDGVASGEWRCPKCGCDDESMLETLHTYEGFCNVCSHLWTLPLHARHSVDRQSAGGSRFASLDQFIRRTGVRRDEVATLAAIGALNAFGFDRRTALWQVEQAIRPAGELFEDAGDVDSLPVPSSQLPTPKSQLPIPNFPGSTPPSNLQPPSSTLHPPTFIRHPPSASPLRPMTVPERLLADYAGTSLTIGPHPMSLRRAELALRGVLRASDLAAGRHGRRVRVAGAVITRQRPGTAKGFVFLTLEDETGIANIIVRPDLFAEQKRLVVGEPYLLIEGTLQIQEGVTSVKADQVHVLTGDGPVVDSHDFR